MFCAEAKLHSNYMQLRKHCIINLQDEEILFSWAEPVSRYLYVQAVIYFVGWLIGTVVINDTVSKLSY